MPSKSNPSFSATQALNLARVLDEDYGIASDNLYRPLGISPEQLAAPNARIAVSDFDRLIGRALQLCGDPALVVRLGARGQATRFGFLGFAAMAAGTIREVLELAVELTPAQTDALRLDLVVEGDTAALYVTELVHFGDHRHLVVSALLFGLAAVLVKLADREFSTTVELAHRRPTQWPEGAVPGHVRVRFDAEANCLCMRAQDLDARVSSADPMAKQLAVQHCRDELARASQSDSLVARAQLLLAAEARTLPGLAELARVLGVSPRTLRRQFEQAGTGYRALLNAARRQRARLLLMRPAVSLGEIADALGFADAAAFSRAFTRWTGESPGRYRKRLS